MADLFAQHTPRTPLRARQRSALARPRGKRLPSLGAWVDWSGRRVTAASLGSSFVYVRACVRRSACACSACVRACVRACMRSCLCEPVRWVGGVVCPGRVTLAADGVNRRRRDALGARTGWRAWGWCGGNGDEVLGLPSERGSAGQVEYEVCGTEAAISVITAQLTAVRHTAVIHRAQPFKSQSAGGHLRQPILSLIFVGVTAQNDGHSDRRL